MGECYRNPTMGRGEGKSVSILRPGKKPGTCLAVLLVLSTFLIPRVVHADEVDDILALKAKNRDKMKRFSAEYTVESSRKDISIPGRMHYRLRIERLTATELHGTTNPWRVETELLQPFNMRFRIEQDTVWFFKDDKWIRQEVPTGMREQFMRMPEKSFGSNPDQLKKEYKIKVLRRNNPIFGPRTITLEYVATTQAPLVPRMEEDINADQVPLETRMYSKDGTEITRIKVIKYSRMKGVPIYDDILSIAHSNAGDIVTKTKCTNVILDVANE